MPSGFISSSSRSRQDSWLWPMAHGLWVGLLLAAYLHLRSLLTLPSFCLGLPLLGF